jgi:hypothetical protein
MILLRFVSCQAATSPSSCHKRHATEFRDRIFLSYHRCTWFGFGEFQRGNSRFLRGFFCCDRVAFRGKAKVRRKKMVWLAIAGLTTKSATENNTCGLSCRLFGQDQLVRLRQAQRVADFAVDDLHEPQTILEKLPGIQAGTRWAGKRQIGRLLAGSIWRGGFHDHLQNNNNGSHYCCSANACQADFVKKTGPYRKNPFTRPKAENP